MFEFCLHIWLCIVLTVPSEARRGCQSPGTVITTVGSHAEDWSSGRAEPAIQLQVSSS